MQGTERTLLSVSTVKNTHTTFLNTGMNFKDTSNKTNYKALFFNNLSNLLGMSLFLFASSLYLNPNLPFERCWCF